MVTTDHKVIGNLYFITTMLFNVHIVSDEEYAAHLKTLVARGQTGEAKGATNADPQGTAKQYEGERVGTGSR